MFIELGAPHSHQYAFQNPLLIILHAFFDFQQAASKEDLTATCCFCERPKLFQTPFLRVLAHSSASFDSGSFSLWQILPSFSENYIEHLSWTQSLWGFSAWTVSSGLAFFGI